MCSKSSHGVSKSSNNRLPEQAGFVFDSKLQPGNGFFGTNAVGTVGLCWCNAERSQHSQGAKGRAVASGSKDNTPRFSVLRSPMSKKILPVIVLLYERLDYVMSFATLTSLQSQFSDFSAGKCSSDPLRAVVMLLGGLHSGQDHVSMP